MGLFGWFKTKEVSEVDINENTKTANFSNFKKVTDYIYKKSGIIDLDKRALTSSRLQQYAISQDIYTTNEFINIMKNSDDFYQEVINIATVNETFFLRELKELEWLVEYIKKENRALKILSMPSSSGEEIYSILLLLSKDGFDISKLNFTGYDINSQAIAHAKEGIYDEHSLHKIEQNHKDKYFMKNKDNYYEISSQLKQNTEFFQQNIFELSKEKNKFDVVLSRNMFIYFDDEKRHEAINIIVNILKEDGIYIKGHADHIKGHEHLKSIAYGIYKKV